MVDDKLKPSDAPAPREPAEARKKFLDSDEHRAIVLGKVKTDEEARLAAEIDKLRDQNTGST